MSTNDNISVPTINVVSMPDNSIHKNFSCENILMNANSHHQLCVGLYAVLTGGASFEDVEPLISLIMDQSEEIACNLRMRVHLDSVAN
ncbi:hypothetical protein [Pseudoalteromonas amylolytica]|uniref:Uncharacterized protein n=1 Tax=Pseudoalteromonas amylolytica TaxID=1859457 RepID=A0A1S1MSX6_9GAMM|nr:hypothetical protein [Pseudoalteromonas amylolytica]OHU91722.1 hypothetical protein BET10_07950 [Pseudoalteromonas amylolytica]